MAEYHSSGLSTTRIEAFTDGVFAVAITLLVLEIKVPHIEMGESVVKALWPLWPKFLSYVVSFGIIGIFWVGHHIMFHYIKRADRTLLWLNTLLLMCISAIPFSAAFIGEHLDESAALAIYGLVLFAAGLVFWVIWMYASSGRRLVSPTMPGHLIALGTKAVMIAPVVYACATVAAFFAPTVSKLIYLVVPLLYVIPSPIDRLVNFKEEA